MIVRIKDNEEILKDQDIEDNQDSEGIFNRGSKKIFNFI